MNHGPCTAAPRREGGRPAGEPAARGPAPATAPDLDAHGFVRCLRQHARRPPADAAQARHPGADEEEPALPAPQPWPSLLPFRPEPRPAEPEDREAHGSAGPRTARPPSPPPEPADRAEAAQPAPLLKAVPPEAPRSAPGLPAQLSTLQALALANPALPQQWQLEINPQALQAGLLLQAQRQLDAQGLKTWQVQLQTPAALAGGAAERERLAERLRRGGLRLQGLRVEARDHGDGHGER